MVEIIEPNSSCCSKQQTSLGVLCPASYIQPLREIKTSWRKTERATGKVKRQQSLNPFRGKNYNHGRKPQEGHSWLDTKKDLSTRHS